MIIRDLVLEGIKDRFVIFMLVFYMVILNL